MNSEKLNEALEVLGSYLSDRDNMDDVKRELDGYLAGMAWSLWRELGVAGTNRFHENCLVQPEELVILTAIVAEYDPRLRDEALDWLSRYHECISVSRLRMILRELGEDVEQVFLLFASALNAVSSAKWLNAKDSTLKVKLSGKSLMPTLESSSLLMFRLRNLFGPGAKADILTHYLTSNGMHFSAADLVEIGYSKRSLMSALDHLAASEVLAATNIRNKKTYELKKPRELQVIVGKLPKIAPPWGKILQAIVAIYSVLPEIQRSSNMTRGVILRNCLIKIEILLPSFISPILHSSPDFAQDWKALMDIFKAFQQGNFFMQFEVHDAFEKVVSHLLHNLSQVDDCLDGIVQIENEVQCNANRHAEVYKECYQLFLSFVGDLKVRLKEFLDLPFHKAMDEALADIPYRFSQEKLPHFLAKMDRIKSVDQITNVQSAVQQYLLIIPEFDALHQLIDTFRKRLADLYFNRIFIHLLMLSIDLHKRHLVIVLFHPNATPPNTSTK